MATAAAIHRVIEQHAAAQGQCVAVIDRDQSVTYRALNQGANTVARRLLGHGFRRGGHAWVHLPRGADLAFVLLGILKAGGSYTWIDPDRAESEFPRGVSIELGPTSLQPGSGNTEQRYLYVDAAPLLRDVLRGSSPNLPVITRGGDVACILRDEEGTPVILVPHEALTALRHVDVARSATWTGEPGAMDLWLALLTGATALVDERPVAVAAA